eukprot:4282067-Prymnesium_polylepis.1
MQSETVGLSAMAHRPSCATVLASGFGVVCLRGRSGSRCWCASSDGCWPMRCIASVAADASVLPRSASHTAQRVASGALFSVQAAHTHPSWLPLPTLNGRGRGECGRGLKAGAMPMLQNSASRSLAHASPPPC